VKKKIKSRKRVARKPPAKPLAVPTVAAPSMIDLQFAPPGLPPITAYPPWRSPNQAGKYLNVSIPTVYRMLKNGALESYGVEGRRRVTSASIRYHMLPPSERTPLAAPMRVPFVPLSDPPKRWSEKRKRAAARN
jgi:excisionase family DNA binding protein